MLEEGVKVPLRTNGLEPAVPEVLMVKVPVPPFNVPDVSTNRIEPENRFNICDPKFKVPAVIVTVDPSTPTPALVGHPLL